MRPRMPMRAAGAVLSGLAGALALAACSWTRSALPNDAAAHRLDATPAQRRLAQMEFGRAARFAACVEPACPATTPKTLAAAAPTIAPAMPAVEALPASPPPPPPVAVRAGPPPEPQPHRVVLHFATNSATLTPPHKAVIASALGELRKAERIVIVGRTDDAGSGAANQSLAFARALAIRDHLLDLAPDLPARIAIDAQGRCCYVAANDSADGRSRNRRAELVFTTPATPTGATP